MKNVYQKISFFHFLENYKEFFNFVFKLLWVMVFRIFFIEEKINYLL